MGHIKRNPILPQLSSALTRMFRRGDLSRMREGEEYICPTCNVPVKPCEKHSETTCLAMIKGNTQMSLLKRRQTEEERGLRVYCVNCGLEIPRRLLRQNPLREVCSACKSQSVRIRTRKR